MKSDYYNAFNQYTFTKSFSGAYNFKIASIVWQISSCSIQYYNHTVQSRLQLAPTGYITWGTFAILWGSTVILRLPLAVLESPPSTLCVYITVPTVP
jgi:hypothetical protein